jgi:hypothetical protein
MDPTLSGEMTRRARLSDAPNRPHVEDVRAIPMRERALER